MSTLTPYLRTRLAVALEAITTEDHQFTPAAKMFVDQSSIYWMANLGDEARYLWIADHSGIDEYVDGDHLIIDTPKAASNEGVGYQGVLWDNFDFENPFHISDFEASIQTVNQ